MFFAWHIIWHCLLYIKHGIERRIRRRRSLRVCTRAENRRNKRKQSGSYSAFKGVSYSKEKCKWFAKCKYKGKPHRLGYFDDEMEAARAYDRKAVEWFKEFARLNFPAEWPPERRAELYAQAREPEDNSKKKAEAKSTQAGTGKPFAKRTTHDAPRTTKKTSPHTKPRRHRDSKAKDQNRATTPKAPKRKTRSVRRLTKEKATNSSSPQ